ncbi:DUF1109 domain-containing protein [Sphingorhabdus sp. Alg239-R122]|uniref:NrsF family protein n=1 Tax=Sphingorhabdus sp. Alg239-R122 TaxID=2305989 RepID=UPI0013D92750|nr:DUF1109 domain-containing protein [Sphingorhabdus sp. Alg239-R122]
MTHNMNSSPNGFSIDALVDDLQPVSPISLNHGFAIIAIMTLAALAMVYATIDFRGDVMAGAPAPMFFLRLGMLLLLGTATGIAALSMGRPAIATEKRQSGTIYWKWAVMAALLFPVSAFVTLLVDTNLFMRDFHTVSSVKCLVTSVTASLFIGGAMTLWMRRGAPTNLPLTGMLIGLSAGSLGAAAYSFHCPFNAVAYNGVWFPMAVGISTLIGWLVIPRLIRW